MLRIIKDAWIVPLLWFAVTVSCSDNPQKSEPVSSDLKSIYTEGAAMSRHRTDPERALIMIDSAVTVGNITAARGEYLKAVTYYGGFKDLSESKRICLDFVNGPEAGSDSVALQRMYDLLATIEYCNGNVVQLIQYATEASRLAHALDMPDEVGDMAGMIARSMARTGQVKEGIDKLKETIDELIKLDTYPGVNAFHSVTKQLQHIYVENDMFQEMVDLSILALNRIEEFEKNTERFGGMDDDYDPSDFIDFAKGQILAFRTVAYARMGLREEAERSEAQMRLTDWSKTPDCENMMSTAYLHLGQWDKFEKAMDISDSMIRDTISTNFITALEIRVVGALERHDKARAFDYLQRAYIIKDSIANRNTRQQMAELATVYHLQEETLAHQQEILAREKAESRAHLYLVIGLSVVMFCIFFSYKWRETLIKNRKLYELINTRNTQTETESESDKYAPESKEMALYNRICNLMSTDRLYSNPDLTRAGLAEKLATNEHYIADAIREGSDGKTFLQFVNMYRLSSATVMLAQNDDPVEQIALATGFSNRRTFNRIFFNEYGMSPTDFRRAGRTP
ncbi:MAG: AraC family transcriptional regulator [Bacteroidaceae bacterium]|nr:AraC family transcriptional regulator [Bacteroidaceae bacterium]